MTETSLYPSEARVGVGAVVLHEQHVLLVRRARPPQDGVWALPGGKLDLGETLQQAVEREVREETGVQVRAREVVHAFDLVERDLDARVRFHYVVVDLRADYVAGTPAARDDAADARWVALAVLDRLQLHPETAALLRKLTPQSPS